MSSSHTFFFLFVFLLVNICLSPSSSHVEATTIYLPVTKDPETLQYVTTVGQRTPLIPLKLLVHLGGFSLWVDCERGYTSSTYSPARCNSTLCTFAKSLYCGDCIWKPKLEPGCNNNTCYIWGDNPIMDSFIDRAEIAEDVLTIGSTPGATLTRPRFIFTCLQSDQTQGLANGVVGVAGFGHQSPISIINQLALDSNFNRTFAICLSSSTSPGVIFIGSGPYYVYNPKVDISKDLVYTPLITNSRFFFYSSEYYLQVTSIRVAGNDVPLNKTLLYLRTGGLGGTRIRTTTPYTIMENSIYDAVKNAFIAALPKNVTIVDPPTKPFGACFSSKNIRSTNVGPDVPEIDFVFDKVKRIWRIYGANSMVQVSKDVMCLGFVGLEQTREPAIVIGGHQIEDHLLLFDIPNRRIGFSSSLKLQKTSCANYNNAPRT